MEVGVRVNVSVGVSVCVAVGVEVGVTVMRYSAATKPIFPSGSLTWRHNLPSARRSRPTTTIRVPSIQALILSLIFGVRRMFTPSPFVLPTRKTLAEAVGLGSAVRDALGVLVAVGLFTAVGDGLGVAVAVGLSAVVGDGLGTEVGVGLGAEIGVGLVTAVGVGLGTAVSVGLGAVARCVGVSAGKVGDGAGPPIPSHPTASTTSRTAIRCTWP